MTDDADASLEDFTDDDPFAMEAVERRVTERDEDTSVIVQHPLKEELPDEAEAEFVETMGLSVSPPNDSGVVTVQNTAYDTVATDRFVAFDVELVDDLIRALVDVKVRHDGEKPDIVTDRTKKSTKQLVEEAISEANRSERMGTGADKHE